MNHFCTISTFNHLYKVYALAESLKNQQHRFILHILIIDAEPDSEFENCRYWTIRQMEEQTESGKEIIVKYRRDKDKLRWSLKSVFMKFLLDREEIDKVIYVDNDLFFYSDYQFLFDLLDSH